MCPACGPPTARRTAARTARPWPTWSRTRRSAFAAWCAAGRASRSSALGRDRARAPSGADRRRAGANQAPDVQRRRLSCSAAWARSASAGRGARACWPPRRVCCRRWRRFWHCSGAARRQGCGRWPARGSARAAAQPRRCTRPGCQRARRRPGRHWARSTPRASPSCCASTPTRPSCCWPKPASPPCSGKPRSRGCASSRAAAADRLETPRRSCASERRRQQRGDGDLSVSRARKDSALARRRRLLVLFLPAGAERRRAAGAARTRLRGSSLLQVLGPAGGLPP